MTLGRWEKNKVNETQPVKNATGLGRWEKNKVKEVQKPPARLGPLESFGIGAGLGLAEFGGQTASDLANLGIQSLHRGNEPETVDIAEILGLKKRQAPPVRTPEVPGVDLSKYAPQGFAGKTGYYGGRYIPEAYGAYKAIAPLAVGTAKFLGRLGGLDKATALKRELAGIQSAEDILGTFHKGGKESLAESERALAAKLATESEHFGGRFESRGKYFKEKIPQTEEANINALANSLKEAAEKDIFPGIEKAYKKFGREANGGLAKIKPEAKISPISLQNELKDIESIASPELMDVINKSIGRIEKIKSPHPELPDQTILHEANPSVNDYIALWKTARDEANAFGYQAINNPNLSNAQKKLMSAKASELRNLANNVKFSIKKSLSSAKRAEYQKIQDAFENLQIPFRESNLLANAIERHPRITTKKFMESLTRENKPILKEYLMTRHPKFVEAAAKHDLMGLDVTNPKAIEKTLQGDAGKALPKPIRTELQGMLHDVRQKDLVDKLLGHVQSKDLKLIKGSPEINKILKQRPDLNKPFKSLEEQRLQNREMEKELQKLGMRKQQIDEELQKYNRFTNALSSGFAAIFGYKKAKLAKSVKGISQHKPSSSSSNLQQGKK